MAMAKAMNQRLEDPAANPAPPRRRGRLAPHGRWGESAGRLDRIRAEMGFPSPARAAEKELPDPLPGRVAGTPRRDRRTMGLLPSNREQHRPNRCLHRDLRRHRPRWPDGPMVPDRAGSTRRARQVIDPAGRIARGPARPGYRPHPDPEQAAGTGGWSYPLRLRARSKLILSSP